jgi:methylglyoxal synthase
MMPKNTRWLTSSDNNQSSLARISLVATMFTGKAIEAGTDLEVALMQPGSLGGEQEIGTLVANGVVKAVIFLRDPLTVKSTEPDIASLLRICDVRGVPLATNRATAEALLHRVAENPASLAKQSSPLDNTSIASLKVSLC